MAGRPAAELVAWRGNMPGQPRNAQRVASSGFRFFVTCPALSVAQASCSSLSSASSSTSARGCLPSTGQHGRASLTMGRRDQKRFPGDGAPAVDPLRPLSTAAGGTTACGFGTRLATVDEARHVTVTTAGVGAARGSGEITAGAIAHRRQATGAAAASATTATGQRHMTMRFSARNIAALSH